MVLLVAAKDHEKMPATPKIFRMMLEIASELGRGSTFTLRLALPVPEGTTITKVDDTPSASQTRLPFSMRVLLAEDVLVSQRLISLVLRRAGAEVWTADDGKDAVATVLAAEAAGTPFDVVLMDMQMPHLDGYGATTTLRAAGYVRPIVALTAHAMSGERERCLAAGCDDFTTKPIDGAELLATMRRQLDRRATPSSDLRRAHG